MSDRVVGTDPITGVALLGDANRRRLYDLVAASSDAVGRDDAAAALGISRELAAFHLDRLVAGGLLATEYRRRSGRSGPGAGRPAKLYRRSRGEVSVALPPRDYARAASVFAEALDDLGEPAADAVEASAREQGRRIGAQARERAGARPTDRRRADVLVDVLTDGGFEPTVDPTDETIRLRNCPYRVLSERHRDLTCGMNLAWASGIVDGLGARRLEAELDPRPDACCVVFRDAKARVSPRSGPGTGPRSRR
jgi:predicted ArsR family transcriptional regulator